MMLIHEGIAAIACPWKRAAVICVTATQSAKKRKGAAVEELELAVRSEQHWRIEPSGSCLL